MIDEVLSKFGLTFEELHSEERTQLLSMLDAVENNQLTVEKIVFNINYLKTIVESELTAKKETPKNWLSLLVLFIPLIGIIRKWYQDQDMLYLQARLRNLVLISDVISRPDKARAELNLALENLAKQMKQERDMRQGR